MNVVHLLLDGLLGRRVLTPAARHVEILAAIPFDFVLVVDEPLVVTLGCLEEHRGCAVAKNDAGGAILVVDNAAHDVDADDEHAFVGAASR